MTKKQKVNREDDPAYKPYKREQNKKRKRRNHGKLNSFSWSTIQQCLYIEFLKNNKNLFVNIEERKKNKVFVQMNLFIKKRGPDQCRSHHQKMSIKYGSIEQIIQRVTEEKILKANLPQSPQNSSQIQSPLQNSCFERILQIQDQPLEKPSEIQISSIAPNYFQEELLLWDFLDANAWISQ